jgi:Fe-Mn family superoxide dismutase
MIKLKQFIIPENMEFVGAVKFERTTLKYKLNSLNKHIDTKTMEEHYNVHYKKYTDNMNESIREEGLTIKSFRDLLRFSFKYNDKLRNNAGGFYNHGIYFEQFTPEQTKPSENLNNILEINFKNFKEEFEQAGLDVFGSGWVWLVSDDENKLHIITTPNQDNPFMYDDFNGKILLGMDMWEHAYYLKHQADKKAHIKDFFKVIDWDVVYKRLSGEINQY